MSPIRHFSFKHCTTYVYTVLISGDQILGKSSSQCYLNCNDLLSDYQKTNSSMCKPGQCIDHPPH